MATIEAAVLQTRLETVGARESLGALEQMGRAVDVLKGQIAGGFAIAAGFAAFNAGLDAIKAGFDAVVGSASDFSARMEQSQIGFETMLGSAARAREFLGELAQFARATPFELPGLTMASQRLLAMGFDAKQIIPLMRDIGNTTAALGAGREGIDRIVRALGQMRGAGRVTAEDMNQLVDVGVNAWGLLGQAIGRTGGETRKLVSEGRIASDVFINAFQNFSQARFGDMMERQSRTMTGALSNIKDSVGQLGSAALQPLFEFVRDLAVRFADFLQSDRAARWASAVQAAARMAADALQGLLRAAQPVLDTMGGLFDRFADLMGVPRALPAAKKAGEDAGKAVADGLAAGITQGNPLDAAIKALQGPLGHLRLAASDIKDAYSAAIDPLKEQAAAMAPIVDFQAQLRDLQLDTESSALREAEQRERILNAGKDTITASGRFIRGRPQSETDRELRLLDIQIEQRKTKAQQQLADINRQIALAPVTAQINALEAAQKAHLAPIEDQLKAQERQLALLQLEKQQVDALAGAAGTAAQNVAAIVGPLTGDADSGAGEFGGRVFDVEAFKKRGGEIAGALWEGFVKWFNENKGPMLAWGAGVVGTMWEGMSGWLTGQGTRLKDTLTAAFSPDGVKAWESWRDGILGSIDAKVKELEPGIRTISYTIAKTLIENAPSIARGFLYVLKEAALLTMKATTWLGEIGFAIGEGIGIALGQWLRAHMGDVIKFALMPPGSPLAALPLPQLPGALPSFGGGQPAAAETPINVMLAPGAVVLKPEMTDVERVEAEKRIGEQVMKEIIAAQQAAA
jgi:tape measure domain-containing protein